MESLVWLLDKVSRYASLASVFENLNEFIPLLEVHRGTCGLPDDGIDKLPGLMRVPEGIGDDVDQLPLVLLRLLDKPEFHFQLLSGFNRLPGG